MLALWPMATRILAQGAGPRQSRREIVCDPELTPRESAYAPARVGLAN